jgi:Ni/Co efflux regulator RcnB
MTRTRTRDRLGLMGIASAIALSAAIGWSPAAWSADKNAQQWQQQGQSHQRSQNQGGQNRGQQQPQWQNKGQQTHNNSQPQWKNGQAQGQPQFKNGGQPQFKNGQAQNIQPQWKNGQAQSGQGKNGQFHPQANNQPQWKFQNGQNQNGHLKNGQFQQGNNNSEWKNGQQGSQKNVQVRTTSVTTRYDWHNYRQGHRPPQWNQHVHDVDFHAYQWNRTSQQRYHYRPYERPYGYYYRHWTYGQVFPTVFWSQNYWLTDYYSFGLVNPPYGYVWVRYGPDALLVNVYDGQILSVEYNVFYA